MLGSYHQNTALSTDNIMVFISLVALLIICVDAFSLRIRKMQKAKRVSDPTKILRKEQSATKKKRINVGAVAKEAGKDTCL
jgi:uncharacterized membrane protein YgcG